ncbi:glycosyltransferase [Planctomycetes bacterium TBK1r]|uniref:Glycosyltransferase EpsD n=1 Tax=Stieleria magnilauensis TaxID=2527963 RepID=A0ABX5XPH5_9BACT|nr:Putative glycosyltransferase EpsD [Planctomycetes bacterium TBK1r]
MIQHDSSNQGVQCGQLHPLVLHTRVISGQGGGPEKTILNSPRFLGPLGYRGVCVYLRDPGDAGFAVVRARAEQKRAPLIEVDDLGIRDWRVVGRMRQAVEQVVGEWAADCRRQASPPLADARPSQGEGGFKACASQGEGDFATRPFLWHGHDYKSNLLGLLLKKHFPQMRLVTTVHGWVQKTWKTPLYYAIDKWCLKRYEHVICVSRDLFEDCQRLGVPDNRLSLIDNAIALDDYDFDLEQSAAKQKLGFAAETKLVVGVGRLSAEKGFDLLIDAVARLIDGGHDVGLAIAGDGAAKDALQTQINATGFADRIRLLGFVADPRLVYRAGDVYTLSSHREGLPNVVLEAMAMRLPVLSTKVAGMPDLVVDQENGLLVDTGDGDAIRMSLERLLGDPALRDRLAAAGRQTVEERFSFASRMEKVAAVYRDLLDPTHG